MYDAWYTSTHRHSGRFHEDTTSTWAQHDTPGDAIVTIHYNYPLPTQPTHLALLDPWEQQRGVEPLLQQHSRPIKLPTPMCHKRANPSTRSTETQHNRQSTMRTGETQPRDCQRDCQRPATAAGHPKQHKAQTSTQSDTTYV